MKDQPLPQQQLLPQQHPIYHDSDEEDDDEEDDMMYDDDDDDVERGILTTTATTTNDHTTKNGTNNTIFTSGQPLMHNYSQQMDRFSTTPLGSTIFLFVRYGMRLFGYAMVLFASLLFLYHFYFYFAVLVPMTIPDNPVDDVKLVVDSSGGDHSGDGGGGFFNSKTFYGVMSVVHVTVGLFLGLNMVFNYVQTVRTPAGSIPTEWLDQLDETTVSMARTQASTSIRGKSFSKYCVKCSKVKPQRAHHCHVCDQCVCRMDHHCPWVNNCIGYRNHRYFILFLFYLWICALYMEVLMVGASWSILPHSAKVMEAWSTYLTFDMVLCGSITVTIGGFLGWHLYLIATNQTTIEFQFNKMRALLDRGTGRVTINEYDVGLRNNLNQIFGFGTRSILWSLLPSTHELPLDGVNYPTMSTLTYAHSHGYVKPEDHMV